MASPAVAATATSASASAETSHTVNLPSDIVSGNLLVILFNVAENNQSVGWPAGYTEFFEVSPGLNVTQAGAYRQANGTEGSTIEVTTSDSRKTVSFAYRITGHEDPSTQAPEASSGADGSSTTPDPDSITPTGGSKDYLFLVMECHLGTATTDAAPTSYTNLITAESTSGERIGGAAAERQLTASSEDPGTFTLSASKAWGAVTTVVHPAVVGAPPTINLVMAPYVPA